MRLALCYLCPPLAVLFCFKPFSAIMCLLFMLGGWRKGVNYALLVVNNHFQDNRIKGLTGAVNNPQWAQQAFPPEEAPPPALPPPSGNPLVVAFRRGQQAAVDGMGPNMRRYYEIYHGGIPPQAAPGPNPFADNDPTTGRNGTRFRRRGE